jgi:hypothetical protein
MDAPEKTLRRDEKRQGQVLNPLLLIVKINVKACQFLRMRIRV